MASPPTEPSTRARTLRWAVQAPFFVMPVLMTIDAPDIHGGFGIHAREALMLGLGGALASELLGLVQRLPSWRPPERLVWGLRRLGQVAALLVAAHLVASASIPVADAVGRISGQLPADFGAVADVWGPSPRLRLALLPFALLAPFLVRPAPAGARPIVLAGVLGSALVVLAGARLVAFTGQIDPPWRVDIWAASALGAVALTWVALRWAPVPERLRRLATAGDTLPTLTADRGALGRFALLAVALVVASQVLLVVTTVLSDGLATSFGLSPAAAASTVSRRLPAVARALPALFAVAAAAHLVRGAHPQRQRVAGLAAWVLASFVGARTITLLSGSSSALLVTVAVCLLAVAWLRRPPATLDRIARVGFPVLGLLAGPTIASLVTSSLLPMDLPVGLLVAGGAFFGGAFATWLVQQVPTEVVPPLRATRAVVIGTLAVLLPIMAGIAAGVAPRTTLLIALLLLSVAATGVIPRVYLLFAGFYAVFGVVMEFKAGPGASECAQVIAQGGATPLVARYQADAEIRDAEPYDALPLPGSAEVLVTFKRIDRYGGFFELVDLESTRRLRLPTPRGAAGGPTALWPERLERDPTTGRIWAQVIGAAAHAMWEVDIDRTAEGSAIVVRRRLDIAWEPGHPGVDEARNRLVLTYVPNRHADNPLVEAFELDGLNPVQRTGMVGTGPQMADFLSVDPATGSYWVPEFSDFARFALVEVDGDTGEVLRRRDTFHPIVGLAAHAERGRLYVTNVTAGTLDVYDEETLEREQRLDAGLFPRDLVLDRRRELLHVAGYADGTVSTFDVSGAEVDLVQRAWAGSLLRGIGHDPTTGRLFAASGCGLFEIPHGDPSSHSAVSSLPPRPEAQP